MSDFPDPSIDYQSQSGDSEFQNMYVTGKLNYRFNNDDITMHTLNATAGITGNVTGNVTGNLTGTATNAINATTAEGLTDIASIDTTGDVTANRFFGRGESLVGISTILQGFIVIWSGSVANIPNGYLLCDGSNGTPDLRDRFIVGAGSGYNPNNFGGNDNVTLSVAQLPAHSHGVTDPGHTHTYTVRLNNARVDNDEGHQRTDTPNTTNTTNSNTTGISINNTGGGQAVDIRPKYYALCFIMKT